MNRPAYILPLIVISQFAGTSLWFAGNAILPDIQKELDTGGQVLANITSVVQLGFISGTLLFAILTIADRFAASKVFFVSSVVAAIANLCIIWLAHNIGNLLLCRFITGFFLAGIYPVGMKIASDWYEKGLGKALGWLVGALVLGTAFPHLLKESSWHFSWQKVLVFTSLFAISGGILILLFVPDGPFRKRGISFHPTAVIDIFRSKDFRSAAFGYFGHMWELYTFWAFVPLILKMFETLNRVQVNIPLWSFIIIASGCFSCITGGYWSQRIGSDRVAFYALAISGLCCLLSVFLFTVPFLLFLLFLLVWGMAVIADSPQFSSLVAQTAPPENKGTALTFVTSVGFAITVVSIYFLDYMYERLSSSTGTFLVLSVGPLLGLMALYRLVRRPQ